MVQESASDLSMESFQGPPFFSHLKKSGQHLPVSAPQALLFTKISARPLTGSGVWISKLADDDDSEVLQQLLRTAPRAVLFLHPMLVLSPKLIHCLRRFLLENNVLNGERWGSEGELRSFTPGCHQPHHVTCPKQRPFFSLSPKTTPDREKNLC